MYARRFVVGSGVGQFYSSDLWDRRLLNVLSVCVCVRTCKHIRWHALKLRWPTYPLTLRVQLCYFFVLYIYYGTFSEIGLTHFA